MHKKILLVCLTFLLVGCTKINKTDDYIELVNNCLSDKKITNEVSLGYKYYIPKGAKKTHDSNYNQAFLVEDSTIYLYVDIISYFYKKEVKYEKNNNAFYHKEINYNGKLGYLEISKENDNYFIKMIYNYSKLEVYTKETNLNKVITLSSIILNSIDYNEKLIERVLQGDFGEFAEMNYEVKKPIDASNSFSQYLEEYVEKDDKDKEKEKKEEKLPDE